MSGYSGGSGGAGGGTPSGPAGGVLAGTYPNPSFAADMATQAELDAVAAAKQDAATAATDAELSAHTSRTDNPHSVTKSQVGLANVDNTADTAKPVSTAQQTALDGKQPLDSDLTAIAALATTATGRSLLAAADAAAIRTISAAASAASVPNASYRTLLDASGSHTAGKTAGTYGMGHGDPLAISGTGTLYPLNVIHIAAADYPTLDGVAAKLRIRAVLEANDVAPTGTYTFGLHPVTRPSVSGGAGLVIYTIGAAVTGSTCLFSAPAADSQNFAVGADFALPADGFYVIGVVQTGTVAVSAHMHMSAFLQMRNA